MLAAVMIVALIGIVCGCVSYVANAQTKVRVFGVTRERAET